ncbi:exopolysaccharide transport family protein [Roseobacter sp. CCS2]|uniref:exopolysaccharide transport family protein n=1 Tax=Roseobacter sp. CCS2 TaxID=391593 RepID=UPI0000F40332|nr:exopolysaccharide transport family protein [Roseobacter sp. CCS2]EBA13103.1 succinoglycan biosynthesis transport protein [Roseobacter sp. CCS2]
MDEKSAVLPRTGRRLTIPPRLNFEPVSAGSQSAPTPLFDFKSVWRLFRRRIILILLVTALCTGATVFLHSLIPNAYTSNTRILLDEQSVNPFDGNEVFAEIGLSNPAVESQMLVMRSPFLLAQVVERLDLSNDVEFMSAPTTPMRDRLIALRNDVFPGSVNTYEKTEPERFQHAVETLRSNLDVSRNARTLVIQLKFTSTSPQLASDVVNAVAQTYVESRLGVRQDTALRAAEWFDERIAELNLRAIEVEQEMQRLSNGETAALAASQSTAGLQTARQALQDAMSNRAEIQTDVLRLRTIISNGRGLRSIPPNLMDDEMRALAAQAETLRDQVARITDETPDDTAQIAALTSEIDALEAAGDALLNAMLADAEERITTAEAAEFEAQTAFASARDAGGVNITDSIEVELRSLEGEARVYRQLYESYLESYLRTVQQQSFPSTEATIIQTAVDPDNPDGPGLARLLVLGVLVGLTLGAAGAFVIEASDGRLRTAGQLSRAARAPFLGALPERWDDLSEAAARADQSKIPVIQVVKRVRETRQETISLPENLVSLIRKEPQMYAAISHPLSAYSETIRRVNVEADNLHALIERDHGPATKIIGFISDQKSKGRSVAAVNYAEMLAVGGGLTVLVDLDWTGLYLTESIAPAAQWGAAELAMRNSATRSEKAFWYDERTSMYFLPNRSVAKGAALDPQAFDQTKLKELISALSMKFENIVLDLSPMAISSDPAAMSDIVSGFVAVADWGQTRSTSLSTELRRAAIQPPKLLGTVMNGVSMKKLADYEAAG